LETRLTIAPPRLSDDGRRLQATLHAPTGPFDLFFEVAGSPLNTDASSVLAVALPLAMARGWDLRCEAPVSAALLQSLPKIQDIYRLWLPSGTRRIRVDAISQSASYGPGREAGCFFSGGVDSYYTYLKNRSDVTQVIFVTGFDILLKQTTFGERVLRDIRTMAAGLGVHLIEVRTNLRDFSDAHLGWGIYHGAALAAVALMLAPTVNRVLIPSSHNYSDLFAWGSHPILDPLWSTEAVRVENDGCEALRIEKLALVAQSDVALRTLRVCFRNKNDVYNCGRCEKCLRTAVALYALGALDRCTTFEPHVNLRRVARLRLGSSPRVLPFAKENLALVQERHDNPPLVRALRKAMRRPGLINHAYRYARHICQRKTLCRLLALR
jgi:hypothetical protein